MVKLIAYALDILIIVRTIQKLADKRSYRQLRLACTLSVFANLSALCVRNMHAAVATFKLFVFLMQ